MRRYEFIALHAFLIASTIGIAAVSTHVRSGLDLFDPKLVLGLTALGFIGVMKSFGIAVAANAVAGFLAVVLSGRVWGSLVWIPAGVALVLLAHWMFGAWAGLVPLARMGLAEATLVYLPGVALFSLLGGGVAGWRRPKVTRAGS